ncbi:Uncharacterised protein [Turicibacter sanguinis]|nr:Uncharacterised protein [Turicibacter sanguinis]
MINLLKAIICLILIFTSINSVLRIILTIGMLGIGKIGYAWPALLHVGIVIYVCKVIITFQKKA